jgi:hypothetical protein
MDKPLTESQSAQCENSYYLSLGIYKISDKKFHLIIKDGLVDIGGELWTTKRLADELFICLAKKKAELELVTMPAANNDSCQKDVDLLEQYESSNTLLYRRYIIRAEKLAGAYCKGKPIIFVINLAGV